MKILYFEIDGFKNIENAHIDLSNVTALMALNSKGKSNLLKGILFGLLIVNNTPEIRNTIYHSYNQLSKPLISSSENKNYRFSIALKSKFEDEDITIFYEYTLKWNEKTITILSEKLKVLSGDSQRAVTYYIREGGDAKYKSTKTRGADNEVVNLNAYDMFNNILLGRKLYYESIIKELSSIKYAIDRHFDNTAAFQSIVHNYLDDDFSFCGNKPENTPENMFLLKRGYPQYFSRVVSAMKILFPDVLELDVQKINGANNVIGVQNYYLLYAKQKHINAPINCSEMSDGFKRVLNNLIFLSICEIKGIHVAAIEEPENSINPTVLGKYIQIIAEFVDSFDIIMTSHSPFLLEYIDLTKIYIGVESQEGNIEFKKIKNTYIRRIMERSEKLDLTTGTYIFDVLSNEEKYNKEILKDALEE